MSLPRPFGSSLKRLLRRGRSGAADALVRGRRVAVAERRSLGARRRGVLGAGTLTAALALALAVVGAAGYPLSFVSGVVTRVAAQVSLVGSDRSSLRVVSMDAATSQYATTTLSTELSSPLLTTGGSAYDTATLSGETATAGGTVTYTVYSNSGCSTGARSAGTGTVMNGSVPSSNRLSFPATGTYYWQAAYSGDAKNSPSSSTCTSEVLIVKNLPLLSTEPSRPGPIAIGTSVSDQATLSGETPSAGGAIYYAVFGNGSRTILVANLTPSNNTVVNGVAPASISWTPTSAGTYYFEAIYSGDARNWPAVCAPEKLVVSPS
jgi:hypothetical protein